MSVSPYSIYVHPWDIFDETDNELLKYLESTGIGAVNVASPYHAGRFLLPHNSRRRIFSAEDGVVYFRYDGRYFRDGPIKPAESSVFNNRDVFGELSPNAIDSGISMNGWAVINHNSELVSRYPRYAMIDPFGNRDSNYLCPNRKDVKSYTIGVIGNISEKYDVQTIQLEAISYQNGLSHGNHHEVLGARIDPTISYLFSMCYCGECIETAKDYGINIGQKAELARKLIDLRLTESGEVSQGTSREIISEDLMENDLGDLLEFKERNTRDRFESMIERVAEIGYEVDLQVVSSNEFYFNEGFDVSNLPNHLNTLNLTFYYPDAETIGTKIRKTLNTMTSGRNLNACIRITYPMIREGNSMNSVVESVRSTGVSGINFYNYGWATRRNLKDLGDALGSSA